MLLPSQMGVGVTGLPFVGHGGMWGDMLLITPLTSIIIVTCGHQWIFIRLFALALVAMSASAILHVIWSWNPRPDSLACFNRITRAGMMHVRYMSITLTVVLMLYFGTPVVPSALLIASSIVLAVHIVVGNHMILNIIRPAWWVSNTKDPMAWGVIVVTWVALAWRTCVLLNK